MAWVGAAYPPDLFARPPVIFEKATFLTVFDSYMGYMHSQNEIIAWNRETSPGKY